MSEPIQIALLAFFGAVLGGALQAIATIKAASMTSSTYSSTPGAATTKIGNPRNFIGGAFIGLIFFAIIG